MNLELVSSLKGVNPTILVVGDIMLDRYTWGLAERVSPEAPVVVLRVDSEEVRLGGAASVATLLRGLKAEVHLAGVVGSDPANTTARRLFNEAGVEQSAVVTDSSRPTTVKERFLGRPEHRIAVQLLRVDHESRSSLGPDVESSLLEALVCRLDNYQAILISDYAKGVCTPRLVRTLIAECRKRGVPILVDPSRQGDFEKCRGATLLKPNRVTAGLVSDWTIQSVCEARSAAEQLRKSLDVKSVVVTLDRDGMVYRGDKDQGHVPATARYLRDITGAGDMAHAMLGFCLAMGVPLRESVELANLASGLEVEREGVEPVLWAEITAAFTRSTSPSSEKVVLADELETLVGQYRAQGKKIVFTNGCFDLLHVGHVTYLQQAARLGDVLVVAINSDATVKRIKGTERPVISQQDRAAMLAALSCVNHVVVFDEDTPHALLRRLRPNVLVKGGTYTPDEVVGREVVDGYGGQVCVVGRVDGISTTNLVRRIALMS